VKGTDTARFAVVVKAAGQPHVVTLWTRPEDDREFMEALRAKRVLTVRQENTGTRKDHGEVGFMREGSNVYLVFPKSLKDFEGKRIVGLKYDLVAEPKTRSPVATKPPKTGEVRAKEKKKEARPPRPAPCFAVAVRRTATTTMTVEVTATSAAAARKLAMAEAEKGPFDVRGAALGTRITALRKLKTNR
jgi:hypothetical protein